MDYQAAETDIKYRNNLLDLLPDELEELVMELGEKRFRAKQIFGWLAKGAASFEEMGNVPKSLREKLEAGGWYIGLPEALDVQRSKDGTVKCLFRFSSQMGKVGHAPGTWSSFDRTSGDPSTRPEGFAQDDREKVGHVPGAWTSSAWTGLTEEYTSVESVFMKYEYGNSICISSQAGCRMGCTFCASTMDGLERGLSGGEMLGEVLAMRKLTGEDINHVVIMGMGEPFDNYDEVARFIRLIHDPAGYGMSLRNITVSTCGIIEGIERFADEFPQVNLAVSLHAPNQELRARTMPIAKKYRYDDLMSAARAYTEKTGRRITFEYAVIDGVNDSEACAEELAGRLRGWLTHVNLIPLNEVEGRNYRQARGKNVRRFKEILEKEGVAVTVRRTLGSDIDAACGQLRRRKT